MKNKGQLSVRAQGTIEYLVIIGIIVVISLVVVSLVVQNSESAPNTSQTSSNIFNSIGSGGISVTEAVSDYDGVAVLSLSNLSGEARQLTRITTDDSENEYENVFIGNISNIDISGLCSCETGMKSKTCNFKFYFRDVLEPVSLQVSVKCEDEFEPNEPPIPPLQPFTFKIQTTLTNQEYKFWIDNAVGMQIDWNLGNGWENLTDGNALQTKIYSTPGDYYIKLKGQASRIVFGTDLSKESSQRATPILFKDIITPLGNSITGLTSAKYMFSHTQYLNSNFTATNFFDSVSKDITDMSCMFTYSLFNGNIANWDVSSVTDMSDMFYYSEFNQDISNWNTSSVTTMSNMFRSSQFNQDISDWNVSALTNMQAVFADSPFNQSLSTWDTSSVTTMDATFAFSQFNQDISNWDVSSVIEMDFMFESASFNQNISDWNVSSVTDMGYMFVDSSFNQDISNWNVNNVNMCSSFKSEYMLHEYIPNFTNCNPN